MLRFSEQGVLEICLHGGRYVPLAEGADIAMRELPVAVTIASREQQVEVTMESSGVRLTATFTVDRSRRRIGQSNGCLTPSLHEWVLHFMDALNAPPG